VKVDEWAVHHDAGECPSAASVVGSVITYNTQLRLVHLSEFDRSYSAHRPSPKRKRRDLVSVLQIFYEFQGILRFMASQRDILPFRVATGREVQTCKRHALLEKKLR
jgi:hypothetical protein